MSYEIIRRKENESWRECVARIARQGGVEREAIKAFDYECRHGRSESDAARFVLVEEFYLVSV